MMIDDPLDDLAGDEDSFGGGGDSPPAPTANPWAVVSTKPIDPWAVVDTKPLTSQWTKENPRIIKNQADYDTLPSDSYFKHPKTGEIGIKKAPPPEAAQADAAEDIDLGNTWQPAVQNPGWGGSLWAGLVHGGKGAYQTGQVIGGQTPVYEEPEIVAAQPIAWKDFASPNTLIKKFLYGFAESAPTMAMAISGGALGTAAAGGPETPVGWAGGIAGTVAGAAAGHTLQSLGANFGQALHEGKDPEAAWSLALQRTGVGAAGSGVGFGLFGWNPFASYVKKQMFETFGVDAAKMAVPMAAKAKDIALQAGVAQPAVAVGETVAKNVSEGKPALEGATDAIPGAIFGTAAPLLVHESGRHINAARARPAPSDGTPPPAGTVPPGTPSGTPPAGLPPVGEALGIPMSGGVVEPMTVARHTPQGDVVLRDSEGHEHRMTAEDVATYRAELPAEPGVTELPPIVVTPEGEARPAEAAPPGTPAAPEPTAAEPFPEVGAARTLEDLEREISSEQGQIVSDQPPVGDIVQQRLVAEQGEMAQAAAVPQVEPPAEAPPVPRGTLPETVDQARQLVVGKGGQVSTGWLMSQLKIPREDANAILAQLEQAGVVGPVRGNKQRQVLTPEAPVEAAPVPEPVAAPTAPIAPEPQIVNLNGMGNAMTGGLYDGLFQALVEGRDTFAGVRDPVIARARPFFDAGVIRSPDDLQALVQAGWDAERAGLRAPEPVAASEPEPIGVTTPVAVEPIAEAAPAVERPAEVTTLPADIDSLARRFNEMVADGSAFTDESRRVLSPEAEAIAARIQELEPPPVAPGRPAEAAPVAHDIQQSTGTVHMPVPAERGTPFERPSRAEPTASPRPVEAPPEPPSAFDAEAWQRERDARIAASRAAGNIHLDTLTPAVETMRGKAIYGVHDPKEMGVVRTVSNHGDVVVDWVNEYSKQKNAGLDQTWLSPHDLRDYVVSDENTPRVIEGRHTKTGADIVTVQLPDRVSKEEFNRLGAEARKMGGYYSAYRGRGALPGFIFKTREAADRFAALAGGEPVERPTRGTRHPEEITENVERAREETNPAPSQAQIDSGVYRKGHLSFHGLPFVIETPEGGFRRGVDARTGEPWQVEMPADYGYLQRTTGADGEHVDAYLGPDHASQRVWVVDQVHADTGAFDEHKILMGFPSLEAARIAYEAAFSDGRGPERIGNITPMSLDELKTWLREGDTKNPIGQTALSFDGKDPTLPTETRPAEDTGDGVQGAVPAGDERAGPEDVSGSATPRPAGPARPAEEPRGSSDVRGPDEGAPESGYGGEAPGGGDRPGDIDRIPAGGETAGQPGAPGGSAGPGRERTPPGRVPGPDEPRPGPREEVEHAADLITGENHVIEPGTVAEDRTPRVKARDNIAAIELAKSLIAEGRPATKEEQAILARYVGWGGLSNAFPDPRTGVLRPQFAQIGERLKELLTPDEYRTAARSTQYAHYTSEPVIRAMWDAVERMGFKGGSVFEPGMGIGHFLGMMPPGLAAKSKYQGIELDHLTAQIAKLLYPQSGVRQADFTRTPMPHDTFDLAIGNPPFGDITIRSDPKYAARGFLLHDYFFAKALDSVRPGGLMGFVTSAGTMNKMDGSARRYLAERAEFVGGVRLPSTAFSRNAGTEVTTDILFFKKRPTPVDLGEQPPGWTETVGRTLPDAHGVPTEGNVNRYFSEHPEQVLGEEGYFDKLYKGRYAVHETPDTVLADRLAEAFERLPENIMTPPLNPEQKAALDFSATEKKEGSFYVGSDGRLMQYSEGAGRPVARRGAGVEGGKTTAEVEMIRQLLPVRDALREVFQHDLAGNEEAGADARAKLNRIYDNFVQKNGPLNKAEFSYRRPSVVQQEHARAEAREEAREMGDLWDEGDFDPTDMIARKAKATEIARARETARQQAKAAGREFEEGSFDPDDMPDIVIAKRPNIDPFQDDQESYRLRALENYNDQTGEASKRLIFYENTLTREQEPQINSAQDGILWSMNKHGRLDIDGIAEKLGVDRAKVIEDLGDQVMRVPGTEDVYEPRDAYLSGDVVSKLAEAKAAAERDPQFQKNVSALEAAQPDPLSPAEIAMNIGMPWLPVETMHEFADSIGIGRTNISYSPLLGRWVVDTRFAERGPRDAEWGTEYFNAHELLSDAMNRKTPVVRHTDKGPPQVTWGDAVATQAAQDKVNAIKEAFATWAQGDPERAYRLAELYNEKYNRIVLRNWNGDYLTTPGVASDWHWRPHQTRVVARIIQDGNTYMAHAVGAGKTSAMIGAGMEMRRLGLVNKPMYVVPNHMLGQFAKEFYEQYPTARIAVADDRNFHTSRRKQFVANVAQQDLDAVIITNSAFKKVPISDEFGEKMIREATDEIDEALIQLGQNPSDLKNTSRGVDLADRYTVKQLQKRKERLEQKLRAAGADQDVVNTFEEMGVDFLFVDEAHQFRKLSFVTQTPMKGITAEGSDMAWDLYTKIRYLDENRPGRSLVMASGTPVTNTMGELYSLSRYMQPQALKERGLSHFDSWSQAFGDTKTDIEQTAQGSYEPVTRFAKFVNMPELYKMVGSNMDVVTSEQLAQYVTRPELEGGKRDFHLAPRTPWLEDFQEDLARRVRAIKDRKGPPAKGDDILLSVINDGRKGGIDPRLVDPNAPSDPSSKLNQMIDNVHRIWEETKDQPFYDPATGYTKEIMRGPATQMVFSNLGIKGGEGKFSAYDWMRREWVRRGIPANEIAFIKDYTTPVAKQRLLNDVNDGKVRILVGSTQKMGTGINAQKRLVAIHNLDPLWFPADDEQRNGRGLRQGNLNPFLQIHDYSTKGTYDSTMWGMMGRKGRFIEQFFRGDPNLREMEDLGEASQYEQAAAMATSDERVIKLTEMRHELQKIERRQSAHSTEQYTLQYRAERGEREAQEAAENIAHIQGAMGKAQDISGNKFQMTVGRQNFPVRKDAAAAIDKFRDANYPDMQESESRPVGEIGGFPLTIAAQSTLEKVRGQWVTSKSPTPAFRLRLAEGHNINLGSVTGTGVIQSAAGYIRDLPNYLSMYRQRLAEATARAETNRNAMGKPFTEGDRIDPLRQEIADLEAAMRAPPKEDAKTGAPGETVDLDAAGHMAAPADDLAPTVGRFGLAEEMLHEEDMRAPPPAAEEDMRQSYDAFAADRQGEQPNTVARDWVVDRGRETGNEHIVAFDRDGNVVGAATKGLSDRVDLPAEALERLNDPNAGMVIQHNHPGGRSLSTTDVQLLAAPGVDWVVAHNHEGDISAVRLSPEVAAAIGASPDTAMAALVDTMRPAVEVVRSSLMMQVLGNKIPAREADLLYHDMINRALDAAGVIDYVSSRTPDTLSNKVYRSIIERAAMKAAERAANHWGLDTGDVRGNLDRSTNAVQPDEGMARLSGAGGERGEPGAPGVEEAGRVRIGEAPDGQEALVDRGQGLIPTDTEAFRRWFGDSKVVDPEGNPLRVYHGTQKDFESFDSSRPGITDIGLGPVETEREGLFFSDDPSFAGSFATQGQHGALGGAGGRIVPTYLSIKRPLDLAEGGVRAADIPRLLAQGLDRNWVENYLGDPRSSWEAFDESNGKIFVDGLRKAGYDGVKMLEIDPETKATHTTWVALDPEQIKSAIGNRGTFNPRDPNILREERTPFANLADEADRRIFEEATDVPRGTGGWNRLLRTFGVSKGSPGTGDGNYWFNPVNKNLTTRLGLARIDPNRSGVKDAAETAMKLDRDRFMAGYTEVMSSWKDRAKADQDAVLAAAEVLTLEGRDVPADGRAVLVENTDHPLAQRSKVGDNLDLRTPERIQMFGDLSRAMDKAWDDRIAEVARTLGWEGEPTYAAIRQAAEEASGREKTHLERAAGIVASVEYQRRAAYLPLMRRGDYFVRVVPKAGTEDKPGIPGWTGDGFPPTTWFELMDSRTPAEKVLGGTRSGTPRLVDDRMGELRQTFPESEYDIEHGYMFRKGDQIKDLPLPAVEKLMMLIGNDVRQQYGNHMTGEAVDAEYRGVVDSLLKQVAEELKDTAAEQIRGARLAGPLRQRRGTPGYDPDFIQSIGKYFNWAAWSTSGLKHRPAIERANLLIYGGTDSTGAFIQGHPDPQVRDFWRQQDRVHEAPETVLDSALNMARQGAFYWLIGGNPASAIKNLFDGPIINMPILSTGLGKMGRPKAYGEYIAAFGQLLKGIHIGKNGIDLDVMAGAKDASERAMLRDAMATDLINATGMRELANMARQGEDQILPQQTFNRRFLEIWASGFSTTDKLNRAALMLSAYRVANREGMDKINAIWRRDGAWQNVENKTPEEFARFMVERAQGRWGIDNKTGFARTQMGGMLSQFHAYDLNALSTIHQMMWRMGPEGKVSALLTLGTMGMFAGALGLPFVQDIEKAYEWTHKLITGVDPNIEEKFLQFMKDDPLGLGANAGKVALHGIQPFGIDLGSLGLGNPLSRAQSPLDMAGPAASIFLGAPYKAKQRWDSGQRGWAPWAELMPAGPRNLVRAYGVYPDDGVKTLATGHEVLRPQEVTPSMQFVAGLGFAPKEIFEARHEEERDRRLKEVEKDKAHKLNVLFNGLHVSAMQADKRGDHAQAQALRAEAQQAVADAPPGVKASMQSLRQALRQAIDPHAAAIKAAPRAVRPQVAQPLYTNP